MSCQHTSNQVFSLQQKMNQLSPTITKINDTITISISYLGSKYQVSFDQKDVLDLYVGFPYQVIHDGFQSLGKCNSQQLRQSVRFQVEDCMMVQVVLFKFSSKKLCIKRQATKIVGNSSSPQINSKQQHNYSTELETLKKQLISYIDNKTPQTPPSQPQNVLQNKLKQQLKQSQKYCQQIIQKFHSKLQQKYYQLEKLLFLHGQYYDKLQKKTNQIIHRMNMMTKKIQINAVKGIQLQSKIYQGSVISRIGSNGETEFDYDEGEEDQQEKIRNHQSNNQSNNENDSLKMSQCKSQKIKKNCSKISSKINNSKSNILNIDNQRDKQLKQENQISSPKPSQPKLVCHFDNQYEIIGDIIQKQTSQKIQLVTERELTLTNQAYYQIKLKICTIPPKGIRLGLTPLKLKKTPYSSPSLESIYFDIQNWYTKQKNGNTINCAQQIQRQGYLKMGVISGLVWWQLNDILLGEVQLDGGQYFGFVEVDEAMSIVKLCR